MIRQRTSLSHKVPGAPGRARCGARLPCANQCRSDIRIRTMFSLARGRTRSKTWFEFELCFARARAHAVEKKLGSNSNYVSRARGRTSSKNAFACARALGFKFELCFRVRELGLLSLHENALVLSGLSPALGLRAALGRAAPANQKEDGLRACFRGMSRSSGSVRRVRWKHRDARARGRRCGSL